MKKDLFFRDIIFTFAKDLKNYIMNYAEQLRDTYFDNKDRIAKQRKEQHLNYVLTLEDNLKDGYKAYKEFCYATGSTPKKMIEFLRTDVI